VHHPNATRRSPRCALAVSLAAAPLLVGSTLVAAVGSDERATAEPAAATARVYVGTYTAGSGSKGIYRLRLDLATGALSPEGEPTETVSPSFLALHPNGRFLYAVNETGDGPADPPGGVSAFAIDPGSGALTLLDRQSSGGPAPCHLSLDRDGKHLLVANYWGGSVAVFPVADDGRLGPASSLVQHTGGTTTPGRDPGPHAHAVHLDPEGRFVLVADLGRDELMVYRFDGGKGTLAPHQPAALSLGEGAGPRHLTFDHDGRHVFVINELASTVAVLAYDATAGTLAHVQTASTLPAGFSGKNSTAEVVLSPDGRFLYGSNRGHDSIAVFAVDPATRRLTPLGHHSTLGSTPRNFAIDPTGRWLLAANQRSDSITVFRRDTASGALAPVGEPYRVPRPVCLRMVSLGQ
jgi:6-phosphogluconolactonase